MTLETLLNEARALEISETQAKDIESSGNAANAVLPPTSQVKKNCFICGGIWLHDSKTGCLVRNRKCSACQKYGHYAKCCSQTSRETHNPQKGKQPLGRRDPKEKRKQNVYRVEAECGMGNVRPCQALMTRVYILVRSPRLKCQGSFCLFERQLCCMQVLCRLWGQCEHG